MGGRAGLGALQASDPLWPPPPLMVVVVARLVPFFYYTTPTPHYFFRLWEASTRAPHLILFSVVRGALVLLCFPVLFWALLVTGFGYLLSRGWVAIFREQNFF